MYLLIEFWRSEYKVIHHHKDISELKGYMIDLKVLTPAKQYFIIQAILFKTDAK